MRRSRAQKAVIVSAVVLLVSLGLCGVNYAAFAAIGINFEGATPGPHGHLKDVAGSWLIVAGIAELIGMALGAMGLLISLVAWGVTTVRNRNAKDKA